MAGHERWKLVLEQEPVVPYHDVEIEWREQWSMTREDVLMLMRRRGQILEEMVREGHWCLESERCVETEKKKVLW